MCNLPTEMQELGYYNELLVLPTDSSYSLGMNWPICNVIFLLVYAF